MNIGSDGSAPGAPDYSSLINAAKQQSDYYGQVTKDQLGAAQTVRDENLPTYTGAANSDLSGQGTASDFANSQKALYDQYYSPLNQKFTSDVSNYDTPQTEALAGGQAAATVGQQYDAAGAAAKRQLQSYGVDPSAGRFAALDTGIQTGKAAAEAGADTAARTNRATTGIGLEATGLNLGNSLVQNTGSLINTGTNAGAGAVNATTSNYAPYSSALYNPTGFGALSLGGLNSAGSFTNMGYSNSANAYGQQQGSSSGIGSALGAGVNLASMFFAKGGTVPKFDSGASTQPSPAARTAGMPVPSRPLSLPRGLHRLSNIPLTMKFAGGGAVPLAGQQVPPGMSPSGGAQTDDVPANVDGQSGPPQARINSGEFITPKDVTSWYGEKFMQNQIMKARKEMAAGQQGGEQAASQGALPVSGPPIPRSHIAAQRHVQPQGQPPQRFANGGAVRPVGAGGALPLSPGAAGGAGRGPAINLGGHLPPRPTPYPGGASAGAVRSAIPGVNYVAQR